MLGGCSLLEGPTGIRGEVPNQNLFLGFSIPKNSSPKPSHHNLAKWASPPLLVERKTFPQPLPTPLPERQEAYPRKTWPFSAATSSPTLDRQAGLSPRATVSFSQTYPSDTDSTGLVPQHLGRLTPRPSLHLRRPLGPPKYAHPHMTNLGKGGVGRKFG